MPGPCWGFAPRDAGAPKVSHTGAADSCRQEHPWSCGVSWPGALWCIGGCTGLPWPTVLWHLRCPQPKRPLPLGPVCSQSNRWPPQRWEQQNRQGEKTWAHLKSVVLMVIAVRRVRDMNC